MKIKSTMISLLLYVIIILNASCSLPEEKEKAAAITIKEGFKMELKPIEVFEKYVLTSNNRLYGLQGADKKIVPIEDVDGNIYPLNDFFKSSEIIYFNVKVIEKGAEIPDTDPVQYEQVEKIYYFMQDNGIILDIDVSEYPEKPVSDFVTMNSKPFEIVKMLADSKNPEHSRVIKTITGAEIPDTDPVQYEKSYSPTAFVMIDGFHTTPEGLWISVPITLQTRLKGVYFYPIGGKLPLIPGFIGRIW